MPTVDLIAGVCLAGFVAWGMWAGVARTLPAAGFAAGAVVGALVAPLVLNEGQESSFALAFALPGALLAGALVAAVVESQVVRRERRLARLDRIVPVSAVGGGLLAGLTGVVAVWLVAAAVAQISSLRDRVEDSAIVGRVDGVLALPGAPGEEPELPADTFPILAPEDDLSIRPVDPDIVRDPQVRRADRSLVQIAVLGCGSGGVGSGWVAADGVVVTNVHVVELAERIAVRLAGSRTSHRAEPIWFEPRNDLALLRVPGLRGVRPLALVPTPREGTAGATLGFPLGRHAIRPARIGRTSATIPGEIENAESSKVRRRIKGRLTTPFVGRSEPGNSGGPLVDSDGRVLTTVWGGWSERDGGWGVPNRFVASALRRAGPAVSVGKCDEASS